MSEVPTIPSADEVPRYPTNVNKHWFCEPDAKRPIYYAKIGPASKEVSKAITVPELLKKAAERWPNKPALRVEDAFTPLEELPKDEKGKPVIPPALPLEQWKTWTYKEYHQEVRTIAKALLIGGFQPHDSCAVYGFNSPEWLIFQNASIFAGGKVAGIYPTDTPDQVKFKCDHANACVLAIDGQHTYEKVKGVIAQLPYIKVLVSWGPLETTQSLINEKGETVLVFQYEEFKKAGEKEKDDELEKRLNKIDPEQPCALIYTSGTTGHPKAVMLSHDACVFTASRIVEVGLGHFATKEEQERTLSYLPLSHVAGMMVDIVAPLTLCVYTPAWITVHFARQYDLKTGSLVDRLKAVRPTLMLGVPRIWEKMAESLSKATKSATGWKGMLAQWAMRQGREYVQSWNFDHKNPNFDYDYVPPKPWGYMIADKLVLSKIRERLGLDQSKFNFTGAAPIHRDTQEFMASFGINVNEVYGLSEGAAATCWSHDALHLWGTVGAAFPNTEVKVFKLDESGNINGKKVEVELCEDPFKVEDKHQGELCTRSRSMMLGYLANPRLGAEHVKEIEEKNAGIIDKDGWLHTGDMAVMSKAGFFKITGRYKELIITAGGENVAPVPIEDALKTACPIISNAVMIGDRRKFNVVLLTLKCEGASGEQMGSGSLAQHEFNYIGTQSSTIDEAMKDEKIIKEITDKIKKTNNNGEVVPSNAAKIQKFMILPRDFSIEKGDLTPTLKLKRGAIADKFNDVIELIYKSSDIYVPFPEDKFDTYFA